MKRTKKLICAGLAVLLLAGCKDATAKLSNSKEALMTLGEKTVTKGEIYNMMFASVGATTANTGAMNKIAEQEVELTDELKQQAESQVSFYTMMYGEQFTSFLASQGLTEQEYAEKTILPSLRAGKLVEKYVGENFDKLCETYSPINAIVLSFSSEDDASAALKQLKDGATPAQAAADNNSTSYGDEEVITINTTSYDTAALTVLRSMSLSDGWTEIPSSDGATFYVLKLVSNNPADFKETAASAISNISAVSDEATEYFLRKYNFHVYDINLYNALKESNPDMLIQDKPVVEETPEAAAESTEEAKTTE